MRKEIGGFLKFILWFFVFGMLVTVVMGSVIATLTLVIIHYPLPARYFGCFALGWIIKGLGLKLDDIVSFR